MKSNLTGGEFQTKGIARNGEEPSEMIESTAKAKRQRQCRWSTRSFEEVRLYFQKLRHVLGNKHAVREGDGNCYQIKPECDEGKAKKPRHNCNQSEDTQSRPRGWHWKSTFHVVKNGDVRKEQASEALLRLSRNVATRQPRGKDIQKILWEACELSGADTEEENGDVESASKEPLTRRKKHKENEETTKKRCAGNAYERALKEIKRSSAKRDESNKNEQ